MDHRRIVERTHPEHPLPRIVQLQLLRRRHRHRALQEPVPAPPPAAMDRRALPRRRANQLPASYVEPRHRQLSRSLHERLLACRRMVHPTEDHRPQLLPAAQRTATIPRLRTHLHERLQPVHVDQLRQVSARPRDQHQHCRRRLHEPARHQLRRCPRLLTTHPTHPGARIGNIATLAPGQYKGQVLGVQSPRSLSTGFMYSKYKGQVQQNVNLPAGGEIWN